MHAAPIGVRKILLATPCRSEPGLGAYLKRSVALPVQGFLVRKTFPIP
jgi:hypothetical protein